MSGTELMEWHQTQGNHMLDVFATIPLIPLQPLTASAVLPSYGATNLLWLYTEPGYQD